MEKDIFNDELKEAKKIDEQLAIIDDKIEKLQKLKRLVLRPDIDINIDFLKKIDEFNDIKLLSEPSEFETDDSYDFETNIKNLLKHLGCRPRLKGYYFLVEAFKIVEKDPETIHAITKEIYPEIAKKYKNVFEKTTTGSTVERCIRHAIETSMNYIDEYVKYEVFGNNRPTNSIYIASVMEYYNKNYKKTNQKQKISNLSNY